MKAPLGSFGVLAALLLSAVAYLVLGYFTPRTDFFQLVFLFAIAFAAYAWLLRQNIPLPTIIMAGLGFRLLLLMAWPALSDDYFRFIWDGRLVAAGENPFLHLPEFYLSQQIAIPGINPALFQHLNSPHYFSVYPPVCQYIFGISSWLFPENNFGAVIVMRIFILVAEAGSFYLMYRLFKYYQLPVRNIGWYALNPLVITELTGNLHFEALMIFFLLGSIYLLTQEKLVAAGLALGLAVSVKLVPLIFMPLLLTRLGWRKFIYFAVSAGFIVLVLFIPFLSAALLQNIGDSLNLYIQKFEFNASIYYLFRELGFALYGYNNIAKFGPQLSFLTLGLIIFLAYKSRPSQESKLFNQPLISRKNPAALPVYFLIVLSIYFFLATTVHPWYITTLTALSVFTPFRFAYVWSGMAVLSYATYQTPAYHENLYLTSLEYTLVFAWIFWEYQRYRATVKKQEYI